jgi:hypothetical protein
VSGTLGRWIPILLAQGVRLKTSPVPIPIGTEIGNQRCRERGGEQDRKDV